MKLRSIIAAAIVLGATSVSAPAMAQVNSVSQFSDVSPQLWSYQALSNLISRYGCVAGYPSGTFKPGQPATRAEMSALVNACLDNITQFYTEADAQTAAALRTQFSRELRATNYRVSALELAAAQRAQGIGNYLGAAVLMNQQGIAGNGYGPNRTVAGATIQGRYALTTFPNQNAVSLRPYVNLVGSPAGQIGAAGGSTITFDWSLARSASGVSRTSLYFGGGYQIPFVNNTATNFQSAVGERGQFVGVVGAETRLTNSLTGFVDVKFPSTNAANSYGVTRGSYSPVLSTGLGFRF